jgi:hypothetical protein
VLQYYTRFKNLLAELKAEDKLVQLHWQKTTFANGLRDGMKREVSHVHIRDTSLTLEQVIVEAETEETGKCRPKEKKCAFSAKVRITMVRIVQDCLEKI